MTDVLQTIRDLKTKAKNRRDMKRYPIALKILDKAIELAQLEFSATETAAWKSQLASELADCYGMQGGIHRRWSQELKEEDPPKSDDHLAESIKAYDMGYDHYESIQEYGIVDSYNMVNRLVSRILYDPRWLSETPTTLPDGVEALDVHQELEHAREVIRKQLYGERRGDIWALADMALVTILLDEGDPASAYAAFHAESPPGYAYESALSTLRPLAERALSEAPLLQKAVAHLEDRLEQRPL